MLRYLILYQLVVAVLVASVSVEVAVFSNFLMPCNITTLPEDPDSDEFIWFQDGRVNRAFNEIILPNGSIPFEQVGPDADGAYLCCYNATTKVDCGDEIQLSVKRPRPKIFLDTFLNITPVVFPYSVYWLPQMLTTPLEVEMPPSEELVEFHCFYYVNSTSSRRPSVNWYFNDLYFIDPSLENRIHNFDQQHSVTVDKIPCEEEYMRSKGSQCFKSTLIIYPPKDGKRRRPTLYTCEVKMSNAYGFEENRLSVDCFLGTERLSKSKWTYGLADMKDFEKGCNRELKKSQSLEAMIQELNGCERNTFLQLWVSPASGSDNVVQVTCSRPFYVVFNEVLRLIQLPADVKIARMFADQIAINDSLNGNSLSSALEKYGKQVIVSNSTSFHFQDKEYAVFEDSLQGNVSIGCQSRQVLVACTYGPLFQLKIVDTPCATPSYSTKVVPITTGVTVVVSVSALLAIAFYLCRRRRLASRRVVWKTVESYTSSLSTKRRLRTPPLPPPPLSPKSHVEYLEVDGAQWPLPNCKLRLEERIACGSYGDVLKGTLSLPTTGEGRVKCKEIVAKVLNDIYSKEHLLEFANEVAILRLIGAHPTIVHFFGCAQRSNLGNQPALITEYASRGSLLGYLRSLRPSAETPLEEVVMTYWWTRARSLINDFLSFAVDIAGALVYLQKIAVAHCDVAARNVLLTASLTAKLNDFGLACVFSQEDHIDLQSDRKIPVRWSAPEVIMSNRLHVRSDVWSFGVLLWEMFSLGETPYTHLESEEAVGNYVCLERGRLSRPPLLDHDGLYALMTNCWASFAESRPDFQMLLEGLQSVASGDSDSKKQVDESLANVSVHSYLPMKTLETVAQL